MKKFNSVIMLLIFCILFLSSCGECQHNYVTAIIPPTCEEGGYTIGICSKCDDVQYYNVTSKLNHNFKYISEKKPSCEEEGCEGYYECSLCGFQSEHNSIEATGHNYSYEWKWASDYSNAELLFTCDNDPKHTISISASIFIEDIKNASCSEKGIKKYTATVLFNGTEYKDEKEIDVDFLSHDFTISIVQPSCLEDGFTNYVCKSCGYSYKTNVIKATGHSLIEHENMDATCETAGYNKYYSCSKCNYETEHDIYKPLGHDYMLEWQWINYSSVKAVFTCKNDSKHQIVKDSSVDSVVLKEATCTSEGLVQHTAKVELNGTYYTDVKIEIKEKINHNYVIDSIISPTCENDGYTIYKCSVCDDSYKDNYKASLNHNYKLIWQWNSYEDVTATFICENDESHSITQNASNITSSIIIPASCVQTGVKTYTAKVMFNGIEYTNTKNETIIANDHHYVLDEIINPTCTAGGYTIYKCDNCDSTINDNYTPILGHNYEINWIWDGVTSATAIFKCKNDQNHVTLVDVVDITSKIVVQPTCYQTGITSYVAKLEFNGIEYVNEIIEVIPVISHSYEKHEIIEPSCSTSGYTVYKCSKCEATYKSDFVEHLTHDYQVINKVEPTCTTGGYTIFKCSRCESTCEKNHVEPLSHDYQVINKIEPTCNTDGYTVYKCSRCEESFNGDMISALGHIYTIAWNWIGYDNVSAAFCCARDSNHIITLDDISITSEISIPPTCCQTGVKIYTAKAVYNGIEYSNTKLETIPTISHQYKVDTTIKPTCNSDGYTIYKCDICESTYVGNYVSKTGHSYIAAWTWDGYQNAIVTFTCINNPSHKEVLSGDISSEITTIATCTQSGIKRHTAKIEYGGFIYEDVKEEVLPKAHSYNETIIAPTCTDDGYTIFECKYCDYSYEGNYVDYLGHNYLPSWTWNGFESATATFICENDSEHKEVIEATISKEVTITESCSHTGLIVYTACVSFNRVIYTTTKKEIIPATTHKYSVLETVNPSCSERGYTKYMCDICEDVYLADYVPALGHDYIVDWIWSENTAKAVFTCENDNNHTETINAVITSEIITPATCIQTGVKKYYATILFNGIEYISTKEEVIVGADHTFEFGICKHCDYINAAEMNNTHGYESLYTEENGENMIAFYEAIDAAVSKYHMNYIDIPSSCRIANVYYSEFNITLAEAQYVWRIYKSDHPLYYWFAYDYNYSMTYIAVKAFSEFVAAEVRQYYDKLLVEFIREYIVPLKENDSIYMKTVYLGELIASLINYKYDDAGIADTSGYAHSIAGILDLSGVVCEGYAMMFNLLLNLVGIENIYVIGDSRGIAHAYNLVKLDDDNWYWYDITWIDAASWEFGARYNYFCMNDTQITKQLGYNWNSSTESFMSSHTPYPHQMGTSGSYELPARATELFDAEEPMFFEVFTVGDFSYTLAGYDKVMVCDSTAIGDVKLPEKVEYLGRTYTVVGICDMADDNRAVGTILSEGTTSVYIPSTVSFITDKVLDCSTLTSIIVDENNTYFESVNGVLYTENLFTLIKYPNAKNSTSFYLSKETVDIAAFAFDSCQYLTTIYYYESLTNIGIYNYGYGYRYNENQTVRLLKTEEAKLKDLFKFLLVS